MNTKNESLSINTQFANTPIQLHQRNDLAFDFSEVPAHWFNNRVSLSHSLNAASLIAPPSERYFVQVMRDAKKMIPKEFEKLQEDMTGFIQQEGMHARIHHQFNQHLESLGYDIEPINRMYDRMFNSYRKYSIRKQLAILAAGEHLTYISGMIALTTPAFDDAHPEARRMWQWHALEEVEHKSVAFDVCDAQGTGYLERVWGLYKVYETYGLCMRKAAKMLMVQEKGRRIKRSASLKEKGAYFYQAFVQPGEVRKVGGEVLKYLNPNFNVWTENKISKDLAILKKAEEEIYAGNEA